MPHLNCEQIHINILSSKGFFFLNSHLKWLLWSRHVDDVLAGVFLANAWTGLGSCGIKSAWLRALGQEEAAVVGCRVRRKATNKACMTSLQLTNTNIFISVAPFSERPHSHEHRSKFTSAWPYPFFLISFKCFSFLLWFLPFHQCHYA